MTASEFETQHSDATVCSGLYTKSTPKWNTKMHASKLLKGVLISRTLNSTSADQESSSASSPARGKRAFSSDVTAPKSLVQRKASSSPVKTTCLCAPTKHAGSFRCRLHRVTQKHWDGRQISTTAAAAAAAASSSAGSPSPANENSGTVGVITPGRMASRSPPLAPGPAPLAPAASAWSSSLLLMVKTTATPMSTALILPCSARAV